MDKPWERRAIAAELENISGYWITKEITKQYCETFDSIRTTLDTDDELPKETYEGFASSLKKIAEEVMAKVKDMDADLIKFNCGSLLDLVEKLRKLAE